MAASKVCQRIFSGIQPTGIPHLGNYFGTLANWIKLANEKRVVQQGVEYECHEPIFCLVDIHALYSPQSRPDVDLHHNTLMTAASLLALGLDPKKSILFKQSHVLLHSHLYAIFLSRVSMARLSHMIQFKEKSKESKLVPTGIFTYPALQAADILLYKANFVPVGEDQQQHIEFTRDIARYYNFQAKSLGLEEIFPLPAPFMNETITSRRIMSLRNPNKKMSKSDPDQNSFIRVVDEPEVILEKCKKAITDSISAVYYDQENRPAVSNLITLYHLATGESIESICDEFKGLQTAEFKLKLADCLVEKFRQPREEFKKLCLNLEYLESILKLGQSKANHIAQATMDEFNLVVKMN